MFTDRIDAALLFTSDSGKYCKPIIHEQVHFPKRK